MMMGCGHVVSKDSLQKLSKANGYVDIPIFNRFVLKHFRRVKCPYCPVESQVTDALRVHF